MGWFFVALGQLLLVSEGLALAVVTGFSLPVSPLLYGGIALFSLATAAFFAVEKLNGYRRYILIGVVALYGVAVFLTQDRLIVGAGEFYNALLANINAKYEGTIALLTLRGEGGALTLFLAEIFLPLTLWLGAIIIYRADALQLNLLLLPVTASLLLAGGTMSPAALFCLLFGVISLLAASRSVRRKRLWGGEDRELYRRNLNTHRSIQGKTALLLCGLGLALSLPGFYAVRPLLEVRLAPAEQIFDRVEGRTLGTLVSVLPQASGGEWNLQVTTAGGGVSDGGLSEVEGYALQGVEDLKVTCTARPEETVYLRGFVGSLYTGDRWLPPDGGRFDSAAANWKTEGNARIYLQNLPFLRRLYVGEDEPIQLTVERLNANPGYTYVPYCAYLNDYYEVQDGDGAVSGQTAQDDVFPFYFRKDYQEVIRTWNEDEEAISVLDRLETAYSYYAQAAELTVPEGFEDLALLCGEQDITPGDVDAAADFIRTYLDQGYTYDLNASAAPEGEDFVRYFLDTSKTGYSVHYASAAVLMFRMCGVPARYVVGYAAPQNLFTAQPGGGYTAILQDDNAHAWAEVYRPGEGWTPVEMTPGTVGAARDVEFVGDEVPVAPQEQEPESEQTAPAAPEESETESAPAFLLKDDLETVVWLAFGLLVCAGAVWGLLYFLRRYRLVNGLDIRKTPNRRVVEIFQAYYGLLVKKGMPSETSSTSPEFEAWVTEWNPALGAEGLAELRTLVLESSYGPQRKGERDVARMRQIYQSLKKDVRRHGR